MKPILVFVISIFILSSCDKEIITPEAGKNVEFYLIDKHLTGLYDMTINEEGAVLKDTVLIGYEEILQYNLKTYEFTVTSEVIEKLNYYEAFAVTVDREIIYTGYFWTSFSSRSVDWLVIDLLFIKDNKLKLELGYPGPHPGSKIADRRNDPRILAVLRRDGKLLE